MSRRRKKNFPAKPRPTVEAQPNKTPLPRKRIWAFRIAAATLVPLVFFLLVEGLLRIIGYGYPTSFLLKAQADGRDVTVQNRFFARRFLGAEMAREPFPLMLARPKPPGTIRVFVFGESAAFGDPQPEFGLPRMLEALLEGRFPNQKFEVVNAGVTAINSHAILPIVRDCADAESDVWVIYMGNNEVVGPFGAGTVFGPKAPNLALIRTSIALKSTRTGQCLDGLLDRLRHRPVEASEWGGMKMFIQNQVRQTDPRMATVYRNFDRNLGDILSVGERRGVKMVVSTVPCNLRDCAPFGSLHRTDLSGGALDQWNAAYRKGIQAQDEAHPAEAVEWFRQAAQLDDGFADLDFRWGRCCLQMGKDSEAKAHFVRARDEDTLRFRCDSRMNEIIRAKSSGRESEGISFCDAERNLNEQGLRGIAGREFFYEHVHLNFDGNYALALSLAKEVAKALPPPAQFNDSTAREWPSKADCAGRLGWSDSSRYEADMQMLGRLSDPPFSSQSSHDEQVDLLRAEAAQLRPALAPAPTRAAEAMTEAAVAANPSDWILEQNLARLQERLQDFGGSAKSWRRVVELLPNSAEAWHRLGAALAEQNHYDEAGGAMRKALGLDPDSVEINNDLARIQVRQGHTQDAARQFEATLRLKPYWGPAHLGLAKILESEGRTNEAQKHFEAAMRDRLRTPGYFRDLAAVCFEHHWLLPAATNFVDALELDPFDAATRVNFGITLELLGNRSEAEKQFAEVVRLNPDFVEARMRLGTALGRRGDDAGAREQFAEAVRLKPDMIEARLDLGIALMKLNRKEEALEAFEIVLQRQPDNAVARDYIQKLIGAMGKPSAPR